MVNVLHKSLKNREDGILHHLLPMLVVVLVAVLGVGYEVVTHAEPTTPTANTTLVAAVLPKLPLGLYKSSNNLQYSFPVKPTYAIQYYGWGEGFQTADAAAAWNEGTESFVELQTCGNPCASTGVNINNVINGTYDAYLTSFANSVKTFNHPVLMTFDHEMNGSWYPWGDTDISSATWVKAWQHVTSKISSIAPNVKWVWAPNIEEGAVAVSNYWPGKGYSNPHVNYVGLDGYFQNKYSTWSNTFTKSVTDVKSVSSNKYPFIVSETGIPTADTNNLTQINNLVSGARSVSSKALFYFDSSTKWTLNDAEQSRLATDLK